MEFLVRTENLLPNDTSDEVRDELRAGERERAVELRAAGVGAESNPWPLIQPTA